jgi:hypothetical protein
MFELRAFLEKGLLPRPGGLNQQHPLVVASLLAIMSAEGEVLRTKRGTG